MRNPNFIELPFEMRNHVWVILIILSTQKSIFLYWVFQECSESDFISEATNIMHNEVWMKFSPNVFIVQ